MGGKRYALAAFHPGKGPDTHGTGGWVGLGAGLDGCGIFGRHRDLYYAQRIVKYQLCYELSGLLIVYVTDTGASNSFRDPVFDGVVGRRCQ